jgi:tetratricopeptide (TPR) repeat protein
MTENDESPFDRLMRHRDERDAVELARRGSGWYSELVEHLSHQGSVADLRSAIEEAGWIDDDELIRTLRERRVLALEEERRAEYALLGVLATAINRFAMSLSPLPTGFDPADLKTTIETTIGAGAKKMAARLMLEMADDNLAEGRLRTSLDGAGEALQLLDDMPANQGDKLPPAELMQLRLLALQARAEALVALALLDRAAAAYEDLLREAASAGMTGLSWFGENEFRYIGLMGLGRISRLRGHVDEAVESFRALVRLTSSWGEQPEPSSLNNLGMALLDAARPDLALVQFRRARAVVAPDEPNGFTMFGEADCLRLLGEQSTAERIYRDRRDHGLAEWNAPEIAMFADRVINGTLNPDGSDLEALTMIREEAVTRNSAPGEQLSTLAMARALLSAGRPGEAADLVRETIARTVTVEPEAPRLMRLRLALVRLDIDADCGKSGRLVEAREQLQTVLAWVDMLFAHSPLDERRAEIAGEWLDAFGAQLDLALAGFTDRDPTRAAEALATTERVKAPAFIARLGRTSLRLPPAAAPANLVAQEERLRTLARSLQKEGPGGARSKTYRLERLEQVNNHLRDVEDHLIAYAPEYVRRRRGQPAELAEIVNALRQSKDTPTAAVSFFADSHTTTAFTIRSDTDEVAIDRCSIGRGELTELAEALRRAYNGERGYPPVRRNQPWHRDFAAWNGLGERLLGFASNLDGISHLVIAPHGPLHLLPLHALRLPGGDYLGQRFSVSYIPSLSILDHLLHRAMPPTTTPGDTVYVAGVAAREDVNPQFFEQDDELFRDSRWRMTADLGPATASKQRVVSQLATADVIHLTCHGVFTPRAPARSGLLFSDGVTRPTRSLEGTSPARRRRFLLSLPDLLDKPMTARLVTLRACSSGLVQQRNAGDEFDGLSRTLLYAGARAVLVSLWKVDQQSSRQLLARFYHHWSTSAHPSSAAAALQRAQSDLIGTTDPALGHPYHWAPFALIGDWR